MVHKRLGRGFDSLVNNTANQSVRSRRLSLTIEIPLDRIRPNPYQPRRSFDEESVRELADSIKQDGVLSPVMVRREGDHYVLVAGERRLRAAKMAGLERIPAIVRDVDDREMLELSIIENIQREDLNPLDKALAYRELMDRFSLTQEQVALLEAFVGQAALAVDSAEAYRNLQDKVQKLAKAYEDLRDFKERAIRTEQLATIGNMAARVAHEIRNPLVTIGGFARAINRSPDKVSRVKSNSWIIVQEVERLERILSNIMNFAKPPSPLFERHNINRIIDETMEILEEEIQRHGVTAEKRLDESIPLVMVDAQQIKQVLFNLAQNAISALEGEGNLVITTEYIPEGDQHARRSSGKRTGGRFKIQISDTGRGIPEELKEKIFTPFFTTKSAGTGLGLAIVKKIVDDHNGTISFYSEIGRGTTFELVFPVSPMNGHAGD